MDVCLILLLDVRAIFSGTNSLPKSLQNIIQAIVRKNKTNSLTYLKIFNTRNLLQKEHYICAKPKLR